MALCHNRSTRAPSKARSWLVWLLGYLAAGITLRTRDGSVSSMDRLLRQCVRSTHPQDNASQFSFLVIHRVDCGWPLHIKPSAQDDVRTPRSYPRNPVFQDAPLYY